MRRSVGVLLMSCLLMLAASCSEEQDASQSADLTTLAEGFVGSLAKEDFSSAVENFDSTMKRVLPQEKLRQAWESVIAQAGSYKRQVRVRTEKVQQFDIVFVTCEFEKSVLDVKVVFNSAKQVSGLWFVPSQAVGEYTPPAYAKRDAFREEETRVGTGEWILPGTLSLPKGDGPFPAVVLVHGSGPHDRDETIGPNKPFRDLAMGLASRGIAVLRYEKRTRAHTAKLAAIKNTITVKEETIDDALAAAAMLRKTEGIHAGKVFVLGHSLGGTLTPRIGARDPDIAGFIIMAGTTRPLEDVFLDQMSYVFLLDGTMSDSEKVQLDKIKAQVARVKDPNLSAATLGKDLPMGVPASYWLDLRGYDPLAAARRLNRPMLILQGERDYQVTLADFEGWKRALSSRGNVGFRVYPELNHLFIEGEGKCTPAEYQRPGHVAETVINDIAHWIRKQ